MRLYTNARIYAPPSFHLESQDLEGGPWAARLRGSRPMFERVLRNLVDNAVKYGPEDIRIAAWAQGGRWNFCISNPGWMTEQESAQKFQAFVQPTKSRRDGSHVGLSASLGLVTAHGGCLSLDNETTAEGQQRVYARLEWPLSNTTNEQPRETP